MKFVSNVIAFTTPTPTAAAAFKQGCQETDDQKRGFNPAHHINNVSPVVETVIVWRLHAVQVVASRVDEEGGCQPAAGSAEGKGAIQQAAQATQMASIALDYAEKNSYANGDATQDFQHEAVVGGDVEVLNVGAADGICGVWIAQKARGAASKFVV